MEDEAITRLNKTPKGTNIKGEAATDSIPEITYLEEGLYNLGYYISIEDVDSIASTLLLEHKISSDFILNLINPKTGKVLQQSKKGNFCLWNAIHSKEIPIRTDLSQTVQMILVNPHWSIFARMGILLLSTAVMVVFAFIGLFYQIKIITYPANTRIGMKAWKNRILKALSPTDKRVNQANCNYYTFFIHI